jgi:DNA polymerase-3 subunit delta'
VGFNEVVGNTRVKKVLQLALQRNRIPNSLLFSGPKGVGKSILAHVLARAVNCEREKDDACEKCPTCVAIAGGRLPDVWDIAPDGQTIKVEQMRSMRQAAYLRPMVGKKRVFIIDEADKMNEEASNTVLKTLEEPPLFSLIILVTSNAHLLLPTIKSRCQILNFSPVAREEIKRVLVEKGYTEERARIISLAVRGNLEEALTLNWDEVQRRRQEAWLIFRSFLGKGEASLFLKTYAFAQRNLVRMDFEKTLEFLASFCRDLILIKENGEPSFLLNPDLREEIESVKSEWSLEKAWDCLRRIEQAIFGLKKNLNMSLLVGSFYSLIGEETHV